MKGLLLISSAISCAFSLNVMSMTDGVILNANDYVELQNFMNSNTPVVDSHAEISQVFIVDITTINLNLLFDVLIFDKYASDGSSPNPDFQCYQELVAAQDWSRTCTFSQPGTKTLLRQNKFEIDIKAISDENNHERHIIIDNTPFPMNGGAVVQSPMTLIFSTRTDFNNRVIVRSILILEGMACVVVAFACGMFLYLTLKMKAAHQKISEGKHE